MFILFKSISLFLNFILVQCINIGSRMAQCKHTWVLVILKFSFSEPFFLIHYIRPPNLCKSILCIFNQHLINSFLIFCFTFRGPTPWVRIWDFLGNKFYFILGGGSYMVIILIYPVCLKILHIYLLWAWRYCTGAKVFDLHIANNSSISSNTLPPNIN